MFSHGDAVLQMLQHGEVIGAVAEYIAVIQGCAQMLCHEVNACGFGTIVRNQFIKVVLPHGFSLHAGKVWLDGL